VKVGKEQQNAKNGEKIAFQCQFKETLLFWQEIFHGTKNPQPSKTDASTSASGSGSKGSK